MALSVSAAQAAQPKKRRPIAPRTLRLVASAAGGLILLGIAHRLVMPPHLTTVVVTSQAVAAGSPVTQTHTITVLNPPATWLTHAPTGMIATHALTPNQPLTPADLTTPAQFIGLKPGEVQWLVPVSGAASGLARPGERVDVWQMPNTGNANTTTTSASALFAREWASGVRVIGIYSSSGQPITANSSTSIGLVGLAVPRSDIGILSFLANPTLIVDPYTHHFTLLSASLATPTTPPTPSKTTTHSASPSKS